MQFAAPTTPPILFDCDMGNSIDDVLALALLYQLEGKEECRIVALSVSKANMKGAALADILIRHYYGPIYNFRRMLAIGLADDGTMPEDTPMLKGVLELKNAEGKPQYEHGIHDMTDTALVAPMLRNALTAANDNTAIIVCTGPLNNLAAMLELRGAPEIIAAKTKRLVVMGGTFAGPDAGKPEYNIKASLAAARKVFAEWPTEIVVSGSEIGAALPFPGSAIEAMAAGSPVADAYRAYQKMPYDTPSWDLTAALYAARPDKGYFDLSEPGRIEVDAQGVTRFTAGAGGKHRHLILNPAKKDEVIAEMVTLATSKPVERRTRRRPPG